MYSYKVDEEEIKKLIEEQNLNGTAEQPKINSTEDLFNAFKEVDNNSDLNNLGGGTYEKQNVDFNYLEQNSLTDEAAKSSAENYYADEILSGKNLIEENALKEADSLISSKDSYKEAADKSIEDISNLYENRKSAAEKDAINRGLARSSIIINKIEAFDKGKLEEYSRINSELNSEMAKIDNQLNMLEVQKQNALSNFDLSYAIKINQKIDELKAENQKKQEEIIKYNNEIKLKEAEFNKKQNEAEQEYNDNYLARQTELLNAINKYGKDVVYEKIYAEKLDILKGYVANLSKEEAIKLVNTKEMIDQIGAANVIALLQEINKK